MNPEPPAPSRDDPVVASLSAVVGGPVGDHAGARRWLSPLRVLLLVTALTFALGLVSKSACAADDFDRGTGAAARVCGSPVADDYVPLGLAELAWPWSDDAGTRARWPATDQAPVVGYVAYLAARATHVVTGSPDLGPRYRAAAASLGDEDDRRHDALDGRIDHERLVFTAGVALGLAVLALLTTLALAAAAGRRRWDAAGFAAAPVLALAGVVSWDLLSVAAAAGALWAFSRDRPALAGALVGVGAAAGLWPVLVLLAAVLVAQRRGRVLELLPAGVTALAAWGLLNAPAFLTGRAAWEDYWRQAVDRGPDAGSLWAVLDGLAGVSDRAAFLGAWAMILVWAARGGRAVPVGTGNPAVEPGCLPAGGRRRRAGRVVPARAGAVAAAPRGPRPPPLARPAGVAVGRGAVARDGLLAVGRLPRAGGRGHRRVRLRGDRRPGGHHAVAGGHGGP